MGVHKWKKCERDGETFPADRSTFFVLKHIGTLFGFSLVLFFNKRNGRWLMGNIPSDAFAFFVFFSSSDDEPDMWELLDGSLGLCKRFFFVVLIWGTVSSSFVNISLETGDVFNGRLWVRLNLNWIGPAMVAVLFIRQIRSICSSSSLPLVWSQWVLVNEPASSRASCSSNFFVAKSSVGLFAVVDVGECLVSLLAICLPDRMTDGGTSCSITVERERDPWRRMVGITGGGECERDRLVLAIALLVLMVSSRSSYKLECEGGGGGGGGEGGGGGGIFSSAGGSGGGSAGVASWFFLERCCFFLRLWDFSKNKERTSTWKSQCCWAANVPSWFLDEDLEL